MYAAKDHGVESFDVNAHAPYFLMFFVGINVRLHLVTRRGAALLISSSPG